MGKMKYIPKLQLGGGIIGDPPWWYQQSPIVVDKTYSKINTGPTLKERELIEKNKKTAEINALLTSPKGEIRMSSSDIANPDAFLPHVGMTSRQYQNTYDNPFIAIAGLSGLYRVPGAIIKGIKNLKFKPNPDAYYRGIGKSGYEDAIKTGVLRSQSPNWKDNVHTTSQLEVAEAYASDHPPLGFINNKVGGFLIYNDKLPKGFSKKRYIAEIPRSELTNPNDPSPWSTGIDPNNKTFHQFINPTPIPINNVRFLKQHWLKKYKEIPKIKFRGGGIVGDPPGGIPGGKEDWYWRYVVNPRDEAERAIGKQLYPGIFEGFPGTHQREARRIYKEAATNLAIEQAQNDRFLDIYGGDPWKVRTDATVRDNLLPSEYFHPWKTLGGIPAADQAKHTQQLKKVFNIEDYVRMAGSKLGKLGLGAMRFINALAPGVEDMPIHQSMVPMITGQSTGMKPVQFRKGGRIPKGQAGIDIPPIIGSDNTRVATSIKAKDLQKLIRQEQIGDVRSEIEQLYPQFAVKESTPTGEIRATNRIVGGITDPRINYAPMGFDPAAGVLVKPQVIVDAINIATLPTAVVGLGAELGYGAVKLARPVAEYVSQVAKLPLKRGLSKQAINYTLHPFPFRKGIVSNEYGRIFQEELGKYSPFHPYSQRLREFGEPKLVFMYNYRRPAGEFIGGSYKIKYDLTIPYEEMAPVMKHEIRHAAQFGKRPESSNLLVHDNRARWDDFLAKHPYEFKKSTPDFSNFSKKSKTYVNDLNFKKAQKVYLDEEKLMESKIDDYLSPYKMNDLDEKFINYFYGRKDPFVAKVEGMDDKLRKRAFWPISDDVKDKVAKRHYDYLTSSHEVDAYMVNAKDKLIEMGLIKSRRDPVTWEMLDKAFKAKGAYSERFYPELIADKYAFVEMVNRLK